MSVDHVSPKISVHLPSTLASEIRRLNMRLEQTVDDGLITRSQHNDMNVALIKMVREFNAAAEKFLHIGKP